MLVSSQLLIAVVHLIILLPFIFLAGKIKKGELRTLAIFFVLYMLWFILTTGLAGIFLFEGQQWNWTGKLAGFLLGVFILYRSKMFSYRETGWTLRFTPNSVMPVLIMMLVVLAIRLAIYMTLQTSNPNFNTETVLFQCTLPAIGDEIIFRGIFLALLNRIFPQGENILGFPLGWGALITSLLYGLVQGVVLQNGLHLQINLIHILLGFFTGLIAAMLKERCGSLLPAIVFHALWNLIGNH